MPDYFAIQHYCCVITGM